MLLSAALGGRKNTRRGIRGRAPAGIASPSPRLPAGGLIRSTGEKRVVSGVSGLGLGGDAEPRVYLSTPDLVARRALSATWGGAPGVSEVRSSTWRIRGRE